MPKLSDSMADAVIIRWLVAPGDAFARGEALIEVETDKATVVYEAEADGTLDAILVPEGAAAAIGEPIATLANGRAEPSQEDGPGPALRDGPPSSSGSRSTGSWAAGRAAGSPARTSRERRPSRARVRNGPRPSAGRAR